MSVWGMTFVSSKILMAAGFTPEGAFFVRFVMAYFGMWLLAAFSKGKSIKVWANSLKDEVLFVILGISGGSMYFLAENNAVFYTQASHVSFIVGIAPLLTAILTILVKRYVKGRISDGLENVKISGALVIGTILCLSGMAMIIFDGASSKPSSSVAQVASVLAAPYPVLGDFLAFAAAALWALYSILAAQLTEDYGSLFATRKVFFWGLVTVIPYMLYTGSGEMTIAGESTYGILSSGASSFARVFYNGKVLFNLFFLGVLASFLGYAAWNLVMAKLGNVTSTNYVYLNPFFTLIGATVILGEKMTLVAALGSAAIIIGVVFAGKRR